MQAVLAELLAIGAQAVVLPALSKTRNWTVYVPVVLKEADVPVAGAV